MEYGKHKKYEIAYIKVDKKIYMPTVERLDKWVDIISKKNWYNNFEFYITGSFTSHIMKIRPFWPTWDVDMVVTQEEGKELDYDLIKRVLLESVEVALIDCDLYESHKISLPFVWDRLNTGAYTFLDEYYSLKFPGSRIAINNFFKEKKEKPKMHNLSNGEFERWYTIKE